jgi:hypothetical protein
MVIYNCNICNKSFNKKSNWIKHTENKKYSCIKNANNTIDGSNIINNGSNIINNGSNIINNGSNIVIDGSNIAMNNFKNNSTTNFSKKITENTTLNNDCIEIKETKKNKIFCKYCLKEFLYVKNLNKHVREERCEILKIKNQQKENIFMNLLEEEKIVNQTKKDLNIEKNLNSIDKFDNNQMEFLMIQIKILNEKFDLQKKESELQKKESELQKKESELQKKDIEVTLKLMTERYNDLENSNKELKKTNEKLQTKMNKIVNKNKIINNTITNSNNTSNNNILNTVINNPVIKLVNFGSEDLSKISHNVFIETIKSQGPGLYNRAIDGIHFNKDYPENQNIYISDINRSKVMIYKNEKWIIDNWDNIFPDLLDKVIQFGYDKEQFLSDCDYRLDGKKFNKQMIKNGLRWYKLLSNDEPDVDYFMLSPEDRPEIDDDTYDDYLEMQKFRKSHPKKETEINIKNKVKLNIYNKREIPIENYKQIEYNEQINQCIV